MIEWKFYIKIVMWVIVSFFMPIAPMVTLVGTGIVADTVLGIWAAKKTGERITSRKFSNIATKMLLYQCTLLFGFMVDVWLVGEFLTSLFTIDLLMTKVITLTLLFTEITSLDENFERITGYNLFAKFKLLLSRTKEVKNMTNF